MLATMKQLLEDAAAGGYAVGAFNVYNLEGAKAVVAAAEEAQAPVMLQMHPGSFGHGGIPLLALCRSAAEEAAVPVGVHLDHCAKADVIERAIELGITSVMADGSHLPYDDNITYTGQMTELAHRHGVHVEAELGRISGAEDGLTVEEFEAKFTDPAKAGAYVDATGVDAIAVCIGNVHGKYHRQPNLDFERLEAIRAAVSVPLVLHGTSGLPDEMVRRSIELGVTKFNVNTEVRAAYMTSLRAAVGAEKADLVDVMQAAQAAMQVVVRDKIELFGAVGKTA